jgi:hypothetical protein
VNACSKGLHCISSRATCRQSLVDLASLPLLEAAARARFSEVDQHTCTACIVLALVIDNNCDLACMQHAIAYTAASPGGTAVYGAKATINVWDPSIQESNGFSLSQLWILSGSFNGSDLNSIEAGWQVRPVLVFISALSLNWHRSLGTWPHKCACIEIRIN